jgi:hypothetical protein
MQQHYELAIRVDHTQIYDKGRFDLKAFMLSTLISRPN